MSEKNAMELEDKIALMLRRANVPVNTPANKNKARFLMRIARHGLDPLVTVDTWQKNCKRSYCWAVDVLINGSQDHLWYASAKSGADYGGPQTLRGKIKKIKREKLYMVPGYAHDMYPQKIFVSCY